MDEETDAPERRKRPGWSVDRTWQIAGLLALLLLCGGAGWLFSRPLNRVFRADLALEEGLRHARNDLHAEAIEAFSRAIAIRADHGAAYFNRALSYYATGQLDRALADINQVLTMYPDYPWAYYERGRILAARGEIEAARADLDHAISLRPSYVSFYLVRAEVEAAAGDVEAACADYATFLAGYSGEGSERARGIEGQAALHCP